MESNNYMYSNFFYFYSININTKNILACQAAQQKLYTV